MAMMTTVEKILAKAEALEAQAAALRLAVTILSGEAHATKRARAGNTVSQAIALRRAQKNGAKAEAPPAAEPLSPYGTLKARRAAKREDILAILRAYGKPMPIAKLAEAARAKGIHSLTGISGMTRSGQLKQTGSRGNSRYSLGRSARHA